MCVCVCGGGCICGHVCHTAQVRPEDNFAEMVLSSHLYFGEANLGHQAFETRQSPLLIEYLYHLSHPIGSYFLFIHHGCPAPSLPSFSGGILIWLSSDGLMFRWLSFL